MPNDPIEAHLDGFVDQNPNGPDADGAQFVDHVEPTNEWTEFRDNLERQCGTIGILLDVFVLLYCVECVTRTMLIG